MIKKFIAAAALLVGGILGAQASPVLTFTPSSTNVTVGQTFTVEISISNVLDLFGWQLDMAFAPAGLLNANSVAEGDIFGSPTTFFGAGTIDNAAGTISTMFNAVAGLSGFEGPGLLATVSFEAMSVGVADLSFGGVQLADSNLDIIFFDNANAGTASITITAGGGGQLPEPSTLALIALALTAAGAGRRRAATPAIER